MQTAQELRVAKAIGLADFTLAMKLSPHAHLRALTEDALRDGFEKAWEQDIANVRTLAMLAAPAAIAAMPEPVVPASQQVLRRA